MDNDLQEAQAILESGGTGDPQLDAELKALVASSQPAPMAGAPAPQPAAPVTTSLMQRDMEVKPSSLPADDKLPTAYYPTGYSPSSNNGSLMFEEPTFGSDEEADAGWAKMIAQAEKLGVPARRIRDEFPLAEGNPSGLVDNVKAGAAAFAKDPGQWLGNAALRTAYGVMAPFGMGVDSAVTGGLGKQAVIKGAELAGLSGTRENLRQVQGASPISGAAGAIGGSAMTGLAKGATQLAGKAIPVAGGVASKALGLAGQGALAGGLTSAVESGVGSLVGGEDRDIVRDTAVGAGVGAGANLVFGGLGEVGRGLWNRLRNPAKSDLAKDINLVEAAGGENKLIGGFGPKPGTQFASQVDDLSTKARASGRGLDEEAADAAATTLGKGVQSYQGEVLGKASAQNQEIYSQGTRVSADRLVRKNLELLMKSTHPDGTELPGHAVSGLGREMTKMANIRKVAASSEEAHMADPDMVMPAGLAARLGIIPKGGAKPGEVVVIEPRSLSAQELDDVTRRYFDQANLGQYDPATAPFKALGHEGVATRGRFGPEVERVKAEQAAALQEMKNTLEASGLPRDTTVNLEDVGTRNAVYNRVRGYKAGQSKPLDDQLDKFAQGDLRAQLDQAAAVGAMQRLRGQATPNMAIGQGGIRPYGMLGASKLHMDPVNKAVGDFTAKYPGLPFGLSAESSRRRNKP